MSKVAMQVFQLCFGIIMLLNDEITIQLFRIFIDRLQSLCSHLRSLTLIINPSRIINSSPSKRGMSAGTRSQLRDILLPFGVGIEN